MSKQELDSKYLMQLICHIDNLVAKLAEAKGLPLKFRKKYDDAYRIQDDPKVNFLSLMAKNTEKILATPISASLLS